MAKSDTPTPIGSPRGISHANNTSRNGHGYGTDRNRSLDGKTLDPTPGSSNQKNVGRSKPNIK